MESKLIVRKIFGFVFILSVIVVSGLVFAYRNKISYIPELGYFGVFIMCFICNATVFAPAPSLLVVATAATVLNPVIVTLVGALGTTLGEFVGYLSGLAGRTVIDAKDGKMILWVQKYGIFTIFLFALIPLPLFDVIGIISGYLKIKWYKFIPACFAGKFIKMFLYAFFVGQILINIVNL